jgi:hypothetical protein
MCLSNVKKVISVLNLHIFIYFFSKFFPTTCTSNTNFTQVYAGGIEFSLEELRAQKYMKMYHEKEAAERALSGPSQPAVSTVRETRSVPLQPLTEPPKRHEKFMVPEVRSLYLYSLCRHVYWFNTIQECLQEPEVSIEEHVAKNYSHLRKAWEENKARQAQIAAANFHLKEQQKPQSYEVTYNFDWFNWLARIVIYLLLYLLNRARRP